MFLDDFQALAAAAAKKVYFLKNNPAGYFILSMLAGAYVGFGVILAFTIGGLTTDSPYSKIVMGMAFGIALSLVVIAGAELFTGNTMTMGAGVMKKLISPIEGLKLWIVCYLGNLAGAVLLVLIYHATGLNIGAVGEFMASCALAKISVSAGALFARGILCNILVCLAVWCGFRCNSDSGKLIMIFWCLFAFVTPGFEHSVANMSLLTEALLNPCDQAVSLSGCLYNLGIVTLGNIVGGVCFVALPYFIGSIEKNN